MVITSSTASVVTFKPPSDSLWQWSEDDWNTDTTLEDNPYRYSKTLAEQAGQCLLLPPACGDPLFFFLSNGPVPCPCVCRVIPRLATLSALLLCLPLAHAYVCVVRCCELDQRGCGWLLRTTASTTASAAASKIPLKFSHSLTHSLTLTHSHSLSLTHSLTHSLAHSLTHSLTHTHSITH